MPTEPRGAEQPTLIEQASEHTPCCQDVSTPCTSPACLVCGDAWPCLVSSLAAEVARLEPLAKAALLWRRDPIYQHEKALAVAIDAYAAALGTKGAGDGD